MLEGEGHTEHRQEDNSKHRVVDDDDHLDEVAGQDQVIWISVSFLEDLSVWIALDVVSRADHTIMREPVHLHEHEIEHEQEGGDEAQESEKDC